MVSPGNQHSANCIGTLSFPIIMSHFTIIMSSWSAGSLRRTSSRTTVVRLLVPDLAALVAVRRRAVELDYTQLATTIRGVRFQD